VRAADGGTLFLDEIGDLALSSQAALLRVLQEQEVMPLGGTRPIKVDVRIICATHRDLEMLMAGGQFRTDLYARLAGHIFAIPPLRERREDLGLLIATVLRRAGPGRDIRFGLEAIRALCRYHWPLNVRELEKCLGSALVLARGDVIDVEHLPAAVAASYGDPASCGLPMSLGATSSTGIALSADHTSADQGDDRAIDRQQIVDALAKCGGNQSRAAKLLGISRNTLIARIDRYSLARPLTPRRP
jgi:sigma-54 dependent transcriptional regulator, acetoin dehydrogenase operon transcriptional activator AcoR